MRSSSTATSSSSSSSKPNHHQSNGQNCSNCSNPRFPLCRHSPSATLDLLILILVLFSGTFLIVSYFSYIFTSLSLLLVSSSSHSFPYLLGFAVFFAAALLIQLCCCAARSRTCHRRGCKGLKKAMEFDLQLQTEDCVKNSSDEIDKLPWKGGDEANPDYECLRLELRKMAPPNGRAVLLFRARCGCPVAKLQGWRPKRGWRHKKKTVRDAENTRKSLHRFAFWVHRDATIGIQGHGQPAARHSKVGPAKLSKRSDARSILYVIVTLTKAARGSGTVAGELLPV